VDLLLHRRMLAAAAQRGFEITLITLTREGEAAEDSAFAKQDSLRRRTGDSALPHERF
jgi:hypothetical protein